MENEYSPETSDVSEEVRLVFFPPATNNVYMLVKVLRKGWKGDVTYYSIKLKDNDLERLIDALRKLHVPLGGRNIRSIRIPLYSELIDNLRQVAESIARDRISRRDFGGRYSPKTVRPEYLVFVMDHGDGTRTIIMLDLNPPSGTEDIPLSWGHKEAKNKFEETYCLIIGHRDYKGTEYTSEEAEEQDIESRGHIYKGVPCPLATMIEETTSNGKKYFSRICKRVYQCSSIQSKTGKGVLYGTDIMSYVLDTRSMMKTRIRMPKKEGIITYVDLGTSSFSQLLRGIDIELSLTGFKLGLRRRPRAYIGAFTNRPEFQFKSVVKSTNALSIEIDARRSISHLYYWINRDKLLKLYTALKLLMLSKSQSYIPRPAEAIYNDPRLSISRLRPIISHYIENPNDLTEDLDQYIGYLDKLEPGSWIIPYLETISVHTLAHTFYLGLLNALNTDQETLGLIIKRKHIKSTEDTDSEIINPIDYLMNEKIYEIIIYEKADTGLGYLTDKSIIDRLFAKNENTGLVALKHLFERIDDRILNQRKEAYSYYKEYISDLKKSLSLKAIEIIKGVEDLSHELIKYTKKYTGKEYTIMPGWLIRYGINTMNLDESSRKIIDSTLWFLLDVYYDISWDVSFEDLIVSFECVYYDLVQYFTLSRRYAEHLIDDLILSRESFNVKSPLTIEAGRIYDRIIAKHSREHAFYTPWIDSGGLLLVRRLLANKHTEAVYLGIRDEKNLDSIYASSNRNKLKLINLSRIYERPLHDKLYANDECEVITTSQNLVKTSLKRNIEGYTYSPKDCFLAHSVIGLSKLLYNNYTRRTKDQQ